MVLERLLSGTNEILDNLGVNNLAERRQRRTDKYGSRPYPWNVPATAAAASVSINVQEQWPESRKYQPLDTLEIINNETANDITVTINGTITEQVPAGAIRSITNQALWHLTVTNNGAAITTLGNIYLTLRKAAITENEALRREV